MITCKCGLPAVVQWKRRPLPDESADADSFIAVYACADHALSPEAAALMHEAGCSGPVKGGACDCTPTQDGDPFTDSPAPERPLPPGW